MMTRPLRTLALLAFLSLVAAPAPAQRIHDLRVERSQADRVPVSLDSMRHHRDVGDQHATLLEVLLGDLARSGLVQITGPMPSGARWPRGLQESARANEVNPGSARLELSLEAGAEGCRWTALLYDPSHTVQLLGKRYRPDEGNLRRVAHHLADEIVRELTGEVGIANTRILFARRQGTGREVWVVDADGQGARQITRGGNLNLMPRWSPDMRQVAYTSYQRGQMQMRLLDSNTGKSRQLAAFPGLNFGASWSPTGVELLATLSRDGNPEIYRLDLAGQPVQRLTFSDHIECSPRWSPNGRQVVFTSDRTGVPQIYVMDREGSNRRRLSYEGRYNESAAWSPRGDRVAFVSRIEGRFDIFMVAPDGSELRRLTGPGDGNNEDPSWAPDGRHLILSSDRDGRRQLWILDVETGDARQLTRGAVDDSNPDWSPHSVAPQP